MTPNDVLWLLAGWMGAIGVRLVLDLIADVLDRRKRRARLAQARAIETIANHQ